MGNWENKKQKPSKIQENIRNGPIKIYRRFLQEQIACSGQCTQRDVTIWLNSKKNLTYFLG